MTGGRAESVKGKYMLVVYVGSRIVVCTVDVVVMALEERSIGAFNAYI